MNKFMVFGSLPQLNYIGEIVFLNGEWWEPITAQI